MTLANVFLTRLDCKHLAYSILTNRLIWVLFLSLNSHIYAQTGRVGINTDNPKATLEIKTNNNTPQPTDGVLIPRLNNFPTSHPSNDQDGMLIFITGNGAPTKGFYYWDHTATQWKAISKPGITKIDDLSDAKSDNDGSNNGSSIFLGIDAGTNDDGTNNQNVGIGYKALFTNRTGVNNVATGVDALYSNTTGTNNIATGYRALYHNTVGNDNIATGYQALFNNTIGLNNIASGHRALHKNISGHNNIANGAYALYKNTIGNRNIAIGDSTLLESTSGNKNIAIGTHALTNNSTGNHNIATGFKALYNNTTGVRNIANGHEALFNNTEGVYNIATGSEALHMNKTGHHNVAIGRNALYHSTGSNNIGIGYNVQVPNSSGSNQIRLGNEDITYAGVQVNWTVTSDRHWKSQIRALPYGLNLVKQLKPVDYIRKNNKHNTREIGFIAQDVDQSLQQLGYNDQGLLSKDDKGLMGIRYNDFIPVLTKAIQEQQALIEAQQQQMQTQQKEIEALKAMLEKIMQQRQ